MLRIIPFLILVALLSGCTQGLPAAARVAVLLSDNVRLHKVEGLQAELTQLGYGGARITVYSAAGNLRVATRLGLTLSPVGMAFARTIGAGGTP